LLITAAILAGGQSRRMGTDKAALELGGVSLLERIAHLALAADMPVLAVGRARPAAWPLPAVTFIDDSLPGLGPLGGLESALRQAQTSVLALACDLPLLTEEALRWLHAQAEHAEQKNEHGIIVVNGEQWEPLFSVYHLACLPLIALRFAAGRRSLHGLIEAGDFAFIPAPAWVAETLVNVNTRDEWKKIGTLNT
jgi:molybdopterin-guanine dinucleotide biosynthesis protein A